MTSRPYALYVPLRGMSLLEHGFGVLYILEHLEDPTI